MGLIRLLTRRRNNENIVDTNEEDLDLTAHTPLTPAPIPVATPPPRQYKNAKLVAVYHANVIYMKS